MATVGGYPDLVQGLGNQKWLKGLNRFMTEFENRQLDDILFENRLYRASRLRCAGKIIYRMLIYRTRITFPLLRLAS
ncbi:MAG: hypothetical protein AB2792_10145 [Candidatus Thiodiazotropha sp.]